MSRVGSPVPMPRFSGLACPPRSCPGYLAVAFRRGGLKTPGGVALPPPGSGGGGARREVGRSGGSPSDSVTLLPPLPPFPRRRSCGGGGCLEPPLGARGGPTRAAGLPDFRGSVLSVPVVGSRVVPVFFRSRPFFFPPPHVSRFVPRWPA